MKRVTLISLTVCWILVIVSGISVLSFADTESRANTEAEQHFTKANELFKRMDYEAAITEYNKVVTMSSNSKIAQDAQYWIGQSYFKAGQFDAALSAFQKLLDEYPTSKTIPTTKLMVKQVQQAKKTKSLFEAVKKGDIEQVKKFIAAGADVNARNNRSVTPLHFAATNGHEEIARLLIAEGANVNVNMGDYSWTPLHDAANRGHTKLVKLLLEKGAKVDAGYNYGHTPLYYAIWSEDEESVRILIAAGADVNGPKQGYPPLFYAVRKSHEGIVKAIIDAGADVNKGPQPSYLPLFYAVQQSHEGIAKAIIDAGADVNVEDWKGWTPLHNALQRTDVDMFKQFIGTGVKIPALHNAILEGNLAKVKEFVESGTDVDMKDKLGWTPAYWALSAGQKDIFEYLLNKDADITARTNIMGLTLLHQASRAGFTEIVEQLIAKGTDVNVKDKAGSPPLQFAASEGHEDIVKLLVAKGANVNATSIFGGHALGDAALAGHEDIIKLLIASGAKVNLNAEIHLRAGYRGTALHAAATGGHSTIVDLLIANGADVNINSRNGTQLHMAARCRDDTCAEIVKKLLSKGADVNAKDPRQGDTPLHIAARRGSRKAAELLVGAGANVNAKDKDGHTPLWFAKKEGKTEMIEFLRIHGAIGSLHDVVEAGDIGQVRRLISKGADVNAKSDGRLITPVYLAARKGHKDICELLITNGAEVNTKSGELDLGNMKDGGWTPLHAACAGGHREVAKLILAYGADVNNKTRNIITPLDLAKKSDQQEVVELLLKYGAKEGISIRDRFKNARLISSGTWLEGSFLYRTDEEWFAIDVEKNKSYLIYYDDELGTGKYSADIETYLYKQIVDDLEFKHCLFTHRYNVYHQPIKFTSDYTGKLYLRLISDNPQNTTFAVKYETEE